MPNTYSGRAAVVGIARQTAEGSAASVPKFETPMGSGFAGGERQTEELPWTFDSQDSAGHYVSRTSANFDFEVPLLAKSSVVYLQSALGARSTSGAGPYTHVLTPADNLAFYTLFYRQPGDNYWKCEDMKAGSWQLSFAPGSPLRLAMSGMGKTATRSGSKWGAASVTEAPPTDPFFSTISATMKFDVANTTPTTTVKYIGSGSISLNRNIEAIQTTEIGWTYMAEQKRDIAVSFDDAVLLSNDDINSIFTGSTSGTSLSAATVYGSCEIVFVDNTQTAAATRSIKVTLPNVLWAIDQIPSADPGGGVTRYAVTGSASKPSSGSAITVTVINADPGTSNY